MTNFEKPGPFTGYHRATKAMRIVQDTNGFDVRRRVWLTRAMLEHANDELPGFTGAELEYVWQRYPSLCPRAEVAEMASKWS
jgi:hypothetical protein